MTNAYVAPMMRNLSDALKQVNECGPRSPRGRFDFMRELVAEAEPLAEIRLLVVAAVDSFCLASFSAFAKARGQVSTPAIAARNSLGLLEIGNLRHVNEQLFHNEDTVINRRLRAKVIAPFALEVLTADDQPAVDFAEPYRAKIELLKEPRRGCPVVGPIMEQMYQRYVDVVFANQLAREATLGPGV